MPIVNPCIKTNVKSKMIPNKFKIANWINNTNVYEVNLRQYTNAGTINAFFNELPRLKDMGVETLWFMPITPIAQKSKKGSLGSYYACSNYTAVDKEFGTVHKCQNQEWFENDCIEAKYGALLKEEPR